MTIKIKKPLTKAKLEKAEKLLKEKRKPKKGFDAKNSQESSKALLVILWRIKKRQG